MHVYKHVRSLMRYIFTNDMYSDKLLHQIQRLNVLAIESKCDTVDVEMVKHAIAMAKYYHGDQKRKSGEPYYSHPIAVAELVIEYFSNECNIHMIYGAILHDIVEDTACTYEEIKYEFGARTKEIVYRLTRVRDGGKISVATLLDETMQLHDRETQIIKVCDRLHNIYTAHHMSKESQKRFVRETIQLFLTLCEDLNTIQIEEMIYQKCLELSDIHLNLTEDNYLQQSLNS